eukprot:gene30191-biopygen16050
MASLLQLLEDQDAGHWSLAPTNTVVHNTALAFETLRHGDHVVVMIGGWRNGYAHHGIVSRPHTSDTPSIANFSSPTGNSKMRDAKLQFVHYDVFLAGHRTFGCVPYSGEEGDEAMQRERAINIASLLIQLPHANLHEYHLIRWNWSEFADDNAFILGLSYGKTYVMESDSQLFALHLEVEAHLEFIEKIERCIPRTQEVGSE